jgi:hypothetical protein
MRKVGLFFGAFLATALFGGTAFAERTDDYASSRTGNARPIKEQVLERMKEGHSGGRGTSEARTYTRREMPERIRPRGEVYGDQATRAQTRSQGSSSRNLSASNKVNTPSEMRAMRRMINPMSGAYRTAAGDGADSYGGNLDSRMKTGGTGGKNLSATGKVNTPSEIKAMLKMINPMHGAYRTAAGDGTDSYGGAAPYSPWASSKGTTTVHFKNDKGEVVGVKTGENGAAKRVAEARERLDKEIRAKIDRIQQRN